MSERIEIRVDQSKIIDPILKTFAVNATDEQGIIVKTMTVASKEAARLSFGITDGSGHEAYEAAYGTDYYLADLLDE